MSDRFSSGTPDAWYSGTGGDLWVEYKYIKQNKLKIKPALSKLQLLWLRRRYEEGRNVAVAVGTPTGVLIYQDLSWENSLPASQAISMAEYIEWIKGQCL